MQNKDLDALISSCAEEPIQYLGEIQNFSTLIAIDTNKNSIEVVSENIDQTFGLSVNELLESDLNSVLSLGSINKINELMESHIEFKDVPLSLELFSGFKEFYCYKCDNLIVLENELKNEDIGFSHKNHLINSLLSSSKIIKDKEENIKIFSQELTRVIKEATDFDRVMVYKFHQDLHGEVIAESKNDDLEPYLGLHYPESDIPAQARELYKKNPVRVIEDISFPRIKLISKSVDLNNFNLGNSLSRHVSPVHVIYLKNMGVHSTLTLSILVKGELWGMIVCHHGASKYVSFSERMFLKLISLSFSSKISEWLQAFKNDKMKKSNLLIFDMVSLLSSKDQILSTNILESVCSKNSKSLLELLDASGVYIEMGSQVAKYGAYPGKKVLEYIKNKLAENPETQVYSNRSLYEESTEFEDLAKECAGAIAIGFTQENTSFFVAWFRPEFCETVKWAGEKSYESIKINNRITLSPRNSFAEVMRAYERRSLEFTNLDIKVAKEFMWFFSKILAEQLIHTGKMLHQFKEEVSMQTRFLSNLSHELRTPLNNILGWLQINENKLSQDSDLLNFSNIIRNNSEQQLRLVNDLLETTQIQTGKIVLELQNQNINNIVREVVNSFKPSFVKKNLLVEIKEESQGLLSRVDKARFEQILRNLIQNAIKFTPASGRIDILIDKLHSDVKISISDTGIGIPRGEINKVFGGFYQVDSGLSKAKNKFGLGLGLSLAKNLVELHEGTIAIFSEGENLGTEVVVTLPMAILGTSKLNEKQLKKEPDSYFHSLRNLKILLVEDTAESARFIKLFLEREGAEVIWSADAHDALAFLSMSEFDLVLSDIGLPVMDGIAFIKEAKKYLDISKTPFIALSAYGGKEEIKESLEAGFRKHLVKPIKFSDLIVAVKDICVV